MDVKRLASLIELRGHQTRIRGQEVLIRRCLQCGNERWNLEVSAEKGVYHCWACPYSGTAASLLESMGAEAPVDLEVRLGDDDRPSAAFRKLPPTRPLDDAPSAAAYLKRRGVRRAEAEVLGIRLTEDSPPRVLFPVQEYWSGRPVGYVTRSYLGEEPKYLADVSCPDSLPGYRADSDVHVLVEGPFDALAVRRAGYGVAMLLGLGREDDASMWAARVPCDHDLVVMLDGSADERSRYLRHTFLMFRGRVREVRLGRDEDPGSLGTERIRVEVERVSMKEEVES